MNGASIRKLDLTLIDGRFLDIELGECRSCTAYREPGGCQRRGQSHRRRILYIAQGAMIESQEPPPTLSPACLILLFSETNKVRPAGLGKNLCLGFQSP
jgi:hypothetical protein